MNRSAGACRTMRLILVALLLIAPAVGAAPVDVSTPNDLNARGEPDVPHRRCVQDRGAEVCASDRNGVPEAIDGPSRVLVARWVQAGGGDASNLLRSLGASGYLAGAGHFEAWHGWWHDINADGYIDFSRGSTAAFVFPDGRACGGIHGVIDAPCSGTFEAIPIADEQPALYVSPGDFNDAVNGPLGPDAGGTSTGGPREPDYYYRGGFGGHYQTPATGLPHAWTDNGLLETTLVETMVDYVHTGMRDRALWVTDETLVDADLYVAVDPTVEALYAATFGSIWYGDSVMGVNPDMGWAPLVLKGRAMRTIAPVVGPQVARILPPVAQDLPEGFVVEDYRVWPGLEYVNVWATESTHHVPGIMVASDTPGVRTGPRDGIAGTAVTLAFYGTLGTWSDLDGDGWIGETVSECGDPHDCGTVQDPNRYEDSNGEYFSRCSSSNDRGFDVVLQPRGGWGAGAYVFADDDDLVFGTRDDTAAYSFNPFDDVVLDVLDARVDRLVRDQDVTVRMRCVLDTGHPRFIAREHLLLLPGTTRLVIDMLAGPVKARSDGQSINLFDRDEILVGL